MMAQLADEEATGGNESKSGNNAGKLDAGNGFTLRIRMHNGEPESSMDASRPGYMCNVYYDGEQVFWDLPFLDNGERMEYTVILSSNGNQNCYGYVLMPNLEVYINAPENLRQYFEQVDYADIRVGDIAVYSSDTYGIVHMARISEIGENIRVDEKEGDWPVNPMGDNMAPNTLPDVFNSSQIKFRDHLVRDGAYLRPREFWRVRPLP